MAAIEYWWIERQREPLTDYQIHQIDRLIAKVAAAIVAETDQDAQDALFERLGDFEYRINLLSG
ncbi:MAG TPA: hypothetical protein PKJ51_03570 [Methanothrix sp.]|nr:hypothetical protein [Methanothrix sp.]